METQTIDLESIAEIQNEIVVREYKEKDEDGVLNLLRSVFRGHKITSDYWDWKYFDNPLRKQTIAIAEYGNQIVGVSPGFYREAKVGENVYPIYYGGDHAVHPDFRRMGISNKMLDYKLELRKKDRVKLSSWVTNNPIVTNTSDKRGAPPFPKRILEMNYIENVEKENLSLLKRVGIQGYKSVRKLLNRNNDEIEQDIVEIDTFGSEADVFWGKIKYHYDLIFKRDASCLNWRYCDPRAGNYRVFVAMKNNEMLGYCAVISVESKKKKKCGYVSDLSALPGKDVVPCLVKKAIETLSGEVNRIKYLVVEGHPNVSVFAGFGFIPLTAPLDIRYRDRDESIKMDFNKFYSSSKLLVQYGDTDLF